MSRAYIQCFVEIHMLNSKSREFFVFYSSTCKATIRDVKQFTEDKTGVKVHHQLSYIGTSLVDDNELLVEKIRNDDTIRINIRPSVLTLDKIVDKY